MSDLENQMVRPRYTQKEMLNTSKGRLFIAFTDRFCLTVNN